MSCPTCPTVAEFVPGYEATGWLGLGAPKGTSAGVIDTLNTAVADGLADPKFKARLRELGVVVNPMTPAEFASYIASETEKWAKVVKFANIRAGMIHVARMERSVIRGGISACRSFPDCASLHPGYCVLLAAARRMPSSPRGKNSTTKMKMTPMNDIQFTVIDEM